MGKNIPQDSRHFDRRLAFVKSPTKEFVCTIINLYKKAEETLYKHPDIKRGRSRTISGQAEDYCAQYLAVHLNKKYIYLIDQPVRVLGKTIYPDIVMLDKDNTIVSLMDVKMDLGWNRKKFPDFCREKATLIKKRYFSNQAAWAIPMTQGLSRR
jgi:hypothetical protein